MKRKPAKSKRATVAAPFIIDPRDPELRELALSTCKHGMSICPTCGHEHNCDTLLGVFPIDAKAWLLHYGDGLSIAGISETLDCDPGWVAGKIRSIDSTIVRSTIRPRPSSLHLRDGHGQIIASEIQIDESPTDPDIRLGLSPRRSYIERREAGIARRRDRLKSDLCILRERVAALRETYTIYTPQDVQAEYDLLAVCEQEAAREGIQ